MSSAAAVKDASVASSPKLSSSFNLLTPLPFGLSQSRVSAWSPVRFRGGTSQPNAATPSNLGKTDSTSKALAGTSITTPSRFTLKSVPWRVTKPRPPPGEVVPPTSVPFAVVAPLKSTAKKQSTVKSSSPSKTTNKPHKNGNSPDAAVGEPINEKSKVSPPKNPIIERDNDFKFKRSLFQTNSKSRNPPLLTEETSSKPVKNKANDVGHFTQSNGKIGDESNEAKVIKKNVIPIKENLKLPAEKLTKKLNVVGCSDNLETKLASRDFVRKINGADKPTEGNLLKQPQGRMTTGTTDEKASEQMLNANKKMDPSVCQNKSRTPVDSPQTSVCRGQPVVNLNSPLSIKPANTNSPSVPSDVPNRQVCSLSKSESSSGVPSKVDAWFKEVQRSKSAGREKPVWAREKISPLHSRFQKTKSFYDDIAKQQQLEKQAVAAASQLRKDSGKGTELEMGVMSLSLEEKRAKLPENDPPFLETHFGHSTSSGKPEKPLQSTPVSKQLKQPTQIQPRQEAKLPGNPIRSNNASDRLRQLESKTERAENTEYSIETKDSKTSVGINQPRGQNSSSKENSELKSVAAKTIAKTLRENLVQDPKPLQNQYKVDMSNTTGSKCNDVSAASDDTSVTTNVTFYVNKRCNGNVQGSLIRDNEAEVRGCHKSMSISVDSVISVAHQTSESSDSSSSVHCGRENKAEGGGVMEDGRILTPRPSYIQPLTTLTNDTWKSQSLPGFYNRPTSPPPPQSFKEAFTSSYSPFSKRKLPTLPNNTSAPHIQPHINEGKADLPTSNGYVDEKKSRRFLGGLFRRRKKEENSSNSSESDSDGFRKGGRFFGKKGKKKDPKLTNSLPSSTPDQVMLVVPDSKERMKSPLSPQSQRGFNNYFVTTDRDRVIKMSPTGSLGRVCNVINDSQPLGIPHIPAQSNLGRKGVSISHDSLAPSAASWNSESAYGSINSSMRSSRLGRSSSTDTLTRKGRREALKSRVEKLREKHTGSSSEEDGLSLSSQFGSETSLNKSSTSSRSRASRTERYLRRKSQELETLKVETEKDKRNREVVQARILEIQKSQKLKDVGDKNDKPKWSAKLVYQVSNQYDHEPVIIRNLSESPSSSRARSNSNHPNVQASVSLIGGPYSYPRNNFQTEVATYNSNGIQNQRSVSYESNINKPFLSPNFTNKAIPTYANSGGFLPPVPPPRDRSRLLSPCEPSRPSSYSFENINQDPMLAPHNTNGVPVPYRNSFHKESSPCPSRPVPPLSPNYIGMAQQLPPTGQCRRSMSEKHLSLTDCIFNDYSNPLRPTPTKVLIPSYDTSSTKDLVRPVSSQQQYSDHAYPTSSYLKSYNEKSSKCIPVTNVPPSPSSDYSSYVSDNSLRTSQLQPISLPPEILSQANLSVKLSDSSNSSSPRIDRVQLRPNEFIGSLSKSDISSPAVAKPTEKIIDSDSSQSSSKGVTHKVSNRPLSMVAEKSESSEKGSPPVACKQKPEPPKRGSSSLTKNSRDLLLKHLELIKELEKDETFIGRQKKFEEVFKKEKERLQKSKCANFEEALNELEEIYKSLNLNSEDIMEGAERRDAQNVQHNQTIENSSYDHCHSRLSEDQPDSRSVAMSVRRSSTPDKTKDDLHYRRVQLSNRNQPDVKKALQITGSYMLVSPVHVPPSPLDIDIPKEDRPVKEADITFDDVTYRNSQRANSIKIIDPQPPFGIPLEPIKQTSHIDYLHHPCPVEETVVGLSKEEPDIVTDDLAFRNLRKDNRTASNKSLNVSELDEILSEANESPHFHRRMLRSASADRIVSSHPITATSRKLDFQTPRKVKQQQRAKRGGKFIDTFKEALTDSESSSALNWKRNPSWIERANLSDNKWENMSTSTETLTEISSTKALSQPDIRHAIIKESRASCGGPSDPFSIELEPESMQMPHLFRVHTFHNTTASHRKVDAKPCQSLDAILNSKPKPFYLSRQPSKETQLTQSPVDIAKLDDLISTLSSLESSDFEKCKTEITEPSDKLVSESAVKFNKANHERAFNSNINEDSHESRSAPNSRHLKSSSTPPRISPPERSTESEKRKRRTEYERTRLSNERKKTVEERPEARKKTTEERPEVGKETVEEKKKKSKEEEKRKQQPPKEEKKRIDETRKQLLDKREKGRESKRESNGRGEHKRPGVVESSSKTRLKKREEIEKKGKERDKGEERSTNRRSSPKDLQKDIDLKGSERDLSRMVRENGVMKMATKSSPLKPIRSQLTSDQDVDKMELEKRERIQRYKEDRRKQMAARYGTTEPSSSDEENSNTTTSAYRRKRRPRTGLDSSSTDLSTGEGRKTRENGSCKDLKITKSKEGSSSEDLRNRLSAKRLDPLSGSASILTSPTLVAKNAYNPTVIQDENIGSKRRETLFDQSLQRIASQEGRGDSADSTLSGSDGRGGRRRPSTEERDKSHKRKSHLNRASTSEEAVYPQPPNISHLSDSSEDAPRRRRRRTPTANDSPFASSPPVTPPTSGLADSPIVGRSIKKSQVAHPPVLLPPLKSPSLLSAHGSHSAPSTLESRFKVEIPCKEAEETSFKNSFNKATPSKITPLRKPDIPDVLKPKEPVTLTSPGVVRTPNTSRPSSVVIEKPPVGPEGVVSRVPLPRSYLRKNSETGTCFMASRREKRGDDSADIGQTLNKESDGANTPSESQNKAASHLDLLTAQALELKSRAEELSEETMVLECQRYLSANKDTLSSHRTTQPKDATPKAEAEAVHSVGHLSGSIGLTSDTGQKNWGGGPEGSGDKVIRRLAFEEEVREKLFSSDAAPSSGPPYNDDDLDIYKRGGDTSESRHLSSLEGPESPPRTRSPLDSILKRRSSREDSILSSSSSDKSSQGILKKASPRGSCSFDLAEGDPRPILKKRSSAEEDTSDPKSILKKKSLTDDEFEYERPRSILKGARSREDLVDRSDGITSPTPILKRSSRGDSEGEGGELRPILKRRDTSDGVRHSVHMSDNEGCDTPQCRVRSDSAPDAGMLTRSPTSTLASGAPTHGILKRRTPIDHSDVDLSHVRTRRSFASDREESEEQRRPISPSLVLLNSAERPLSVAERIAGMEALQTSQVPVSPAPLYSPGVKPKVRTSTDEGAASPFSSDRENRRNSWVSPTRPENISFEPEKVTEAFNPMFNQASRVTQKAAFFAKLEQESGSVSPSRKDRGARFSTQPVTEGEVNQAAKIADGVNGRESTKDSIAQESLPQSATASAQSEGSVGARVAMWSKRLQELQSKPTPPSIDTLRRKSRSARFRTQPITLEEVAQAHELNNQETTNRSQARVSIKSSSETISDARSSGENTFHSLGRRASAHDLTYSDSGQNDALKGILKNEHIRDRSKESPRSILKPDSRRSSMCENDPLKGILKSESPMTSAVGSPEHDVRPLRSVLKKESSLEEIYKESKEIRSILKPESECLEPEMSSDSSSELVQSSSNGVSCTLTKESTEVSADTYNTVMTAGDYAEFCRMSRSSTKRSLLQKTPSKQGLPMKSKDNLAEALRQIEPIRDKSKGRENRRDVSEEKREKENNLNNNSLKSRKISHEEKPIPKGDSIFQNGTHRQEEEVIDEIKSSFEENMRSLTDLSSQEESTTRVTFRQKTHQKSSTKHTERWTMNDFSSCDSSSKIEKLSPSNSDSSSSSSPPTAFTSPNAALPPTPPFTGAKTPSGGIEANSGALPYSRSSPITIPPVGGQLEKPENTSTLMTSSSGSSINARLVALQKNGEEGWKNRLPRLDGEAEFEILSPKLSRSKARPTSLLERVTLLETSSQQWKGRVSQSDATKFTVAHKMASASSVPSLIASKTELTSISSSKVTTTVSGLLASPSSSLPGFAVSPASERKRRTPMPKVFKSKTGSCIPDLISQNAAKESGARLAKEFARSISVESEAAREERPVVNIPRIDDDYFDAFFGSSALAARDSTNEVRIDYSDFDQISSNTTQLVVQRRNIKATRKYQTTKNPLKSLAAREDLKDEYIDVKLGAGERELRRMKVEELSKSSSFAMEALAGLASKENFSAVSLKKVEDSPVVRELAPFNDLMLLQVKGRKRPQVRLVKPCCESVNAGDDFLLVTPSELFHYKGEFSNVIERAVASDIASYILQTKDLGTASVLRVTDVREASPSATKERFWSKLGGNSESSAMPAGLPDEDDDFEAAIVASNKIFEVRDEALVPIADTWGLCPKCAILRSDKVLVFDFGSEVYLWGGKRTSTEDKKKGLQLLRELWKEEYDYSDCDINPITPSTLNSTNKSCMNGFRPKWGVCGKITENVETILFKEKFLDWPDTAQQTRIKEIRKEADHRVDPVNDLEPCDVRTMIESQPEDPDLVLEMSRLGRGVQYYDEEERRMHNISTNEFKVWHIAENEKYLRSSESAVHFFSEETYVVRWYYHVTATGRTLKGTPSKHNVTGRSRVAYFFWQGKNSSISDKGVSALMTVEMDEERGPHVRVTMGFEPPAFLNLFQGQLVIHAGKREDLAEKTPSNRLFIMRGEAENEAHLVEVPLSASHLRSKGCLILISPSKGIVFLWIGCKAANHVKEIAAKLAKLLQHSHSSEVGWRTDSPRLKEEKEGSESAEFKSLLGLSGSIIPYHSLLSELKNKKDVTTRVWKLEVCVDELQPNEILSAYRIPGVASPFPIWQEEIYSTTQPALFLVDTGSKVFVWQGWFPDEVEAEDDASSATTGSAFLRFTFARRSALQTALLYVSKLEEVNKGIKMDPPEMAISGMESLEFSNLFPIWTHHSDVEAVQVKEGRWKKGTTYLVKDIYKQLCRSRYTLDELQKKPLPDGVDPSRLEKYLSEEEFEEVLGTDRGAFVRLPSWKKLHLKKKANLF